MLVVPKLAKDDISWLSVWLPGIPHTIYDIGDPSAPHHVPANRGKEAMTYLTYIIDHFDCLPAKIVFMHSHRNAWHTADAVESLTKLR